MGQNLYKFIFSDGVIVANVIACADKSLTEKDIFRKVTTDVVVNYCEDNHYPYKETMVDRFIDNLNVQKLGSFIPDNDSYCNEDYTILALNKTVNWKS